MPRTDRPAPTQSTVLGPVYGASRTMPMPERTMAMITTSRRNATRHDR